MGLRQLPVGPPHLFNVAVSGLSSGTREVRRTTLSHLPHREGQQIVLILSSGNISTEQSTELVIHFKTVLDVFAHPVLQ